MEKLDKLKFILHRIDHYFNGVNLKGTFFLGVNTFVLGGCFAAFQSDTVANSMDFWLSANFSLIALFSLGSIWYVLWAILPYLDHGKSYDYESNIFFGAIAGKEFKQFKEEINEASDSDFAEDMIRQVQILSRGLKKKYHRIRNAGVLLFMSMLSVIPFFYQIIQLRS